MIDNLHKFLEQQFSDFTGTPISLKNGSYSSIMINKMLIQIQIIMMVL